MAMQTRKRHVVVKFVNKSPNEDPCYNKSGDSGFDLRAWLNDETKATIRYAEEVGKKYIIIAPLERVLIHTGLYFDIPGSTEIQVRARSGMALKRGLGVLNGPATIDSNYTGEVCIIAVNLSNSNITIEDGERIAQAVVCPVYNSRITELSKVESIEKETERGSDGFNSTGSK